MSNKNESVLPGLLFIATWWALSQYPFFEHFAFLETLALWGVGWLAIRMFGSATHRLGFKGWMLILQIAGWYGAFLSLVPFGGVAKLLLLWGVATPLLFVGGLWRMAYLRFPRLQHTMSCIPRALCAAALTILPLVSWFQGFGLWLGVFAAAAICALTAIPLYYGWRLAEQPPRGERDARFGTDEAYRRAGMSDER